MNTNPKATLYALSSFALAGICFFNSAAPAQVAAPSRNEAPAVVESKTADAATILAAVRRATGIERLRDFPSGVRLSGTARFLGQDAPYEQIFDGEGRFVSSIRGSIGITFGSDGSTVWSTDIGGEGRVLELGDRSAAWLNEGIATHRHFQPGAGLAFTADEPHTNEAVLALAFTHDDGNITGRVEIDRATNLPVRWVFTSPPTTTTIELTGVTEFGGLRLPRSISATSSGGTENSFTIAEASEAPTFIRSPFEFLGPAFDDTRFDPSIPPALEVKRAKTGHLLVHPRIDGKDVGWFIFDTGAGITVLDTKTVETLGLTRQGTVPAMGAGGSTQSGLARIGEFSLGPITITDQLVLDLNIGFLSPLMGETIAGIVGYPVLARSVVSVDMQTPAVSIHNPAAFTLSSGEWSTLHVYERHPCVEGVLEGHPGIFRLDTGAGANTVTVHVPFVQRHALLDGRETTDSMFGGVGGMVKAKAGMVKSMTLGGHTHENFTAQFAIEPKGAMADPYLAGNLGGGLVSPFIVTFDYRNNRIAFVPRGEPK